MHLLSSRAARHGPPALSRYTLGVMLAHARAHEPHALLRAFMRSCVPVGVPVDAVERAARQRGPYAMRSSLPPTRNGTRKVWPSAAHTALVWSALVYVARGTRFKDLYDDLLSQARAMKDKKQAGVESAEHALPAYDAAHFQPFVARHAYRFRPDLAARVLGDMQDLGVRPSAHTLAALAGAYAKVGDATRAGAILSVMAEFGEGFEHEEKTVAYSAVLRGLLDRGMWGEAEGVVRRMRDAGLVAVCDEKVELLVRWARERKVPDVLRRGRRRRATVYEKEEQGTITTA